MNRSRLILRKARRALRSRRYNRRSRTEDCLTPRSRDTSEKRQKKLFSDSRSKRLGISIGSIPPATTANINLLARIISAEGRGEPYIGQVAIGAVIMNRIEHPSFPDTLAGIIYENGAFTALVDGQFNEPIADSAYDAARDALSGWDPTGGCIYYYNPKKTSNQFMMSRPVQKVIGQHYFCT